jgi:hypothetical protein
LSWQREWREQIWFSGHSRHREAADISVDHHQVVENYRSAHEIAMRVGKDKATTEDLTTGMIHYRSLFEELVQVPTTFKQREVA